MSTTTLDDLQNAVPDAHLIASSLVDSAKQLKRQAPATADLTSAITDILPESHIKGASVLKITMLDPQFALLDSGFFTPADDGLAPGKQQVETITKSKSGRTLKRTKQRLIGVSGTLDPLEIHYPEKMPDGTPGKYWWRLSTLSPASDGTITLTFIDRVADELMNRRDRRRTNRASTTRAEFIKQVVGRVPEAVFHSMELDVAQKIDATKIKSAKKKGIAKKGKHQLTSQGQPLTKAQEDVLSHIFWSCAVNNATEPAQVAAVFAAIWESNLTVITTPNQYNVYGVFSGNANYFQAGDIQGMCQSFLLGGKGFQSGGANVLSFSVNNPIEIAVRVEAPSIWPDNAYARETSYLGDARALAEANNIVQNGGGAGTGGATGGAKNTTTTVQTTQPYFFQVGPPNNPRETDWDAIQRLAQEVNWELFTDGPDMYYDSEFQLITQQPADIIFRSDPRLIDWSYDWENRNIATVFNLTLICDPFEYRAGDVLVLKGFGVDQASTHKLPGRWLVQDVVRNAASLTSAITLKQPEPPKNEPAPNTTSQTVTTGKGHKFIVGGVTNPAPGNTSGRYDMGVDGNYGKAGCVAPYDGTVHVDRRGWPGQGDYIWILNDDQTGADYQKAMYFAEGAVATVGDKSHVTAGTKIGQPVASGGNGTAGNFEIGPANTTNGDPLAKNYGLGSTGAAKMVEAFAAWIEAAGFAHTKSGSDQAGQA